MYPNSHWSSYPQYNVMPGALSTSRATVPGLEQAAGLTAAAGLTHGLQPHSSLSQRVLSTIPGVNLPRDLHSSAAVSQLLGAMSPHVGSFSTQSLHKAGVSLAQNQLAYESLVNEQQAPVTSAHSSVTGYSPEKSKDPPQSFSPSVTQSLQDASAKSWLLYDYLPQMSSNSYAALSGVDLTNVEAFSAETLRLSQPPPAHSSVSRHSTIQRTPFPTEALMSDPLSQSSKSVSSLLSKQSQGQSSSMYTLQDDLRQQTLSSRTASQTPQPQVESYVLPQDLKDTSRSSQSSQNQYYYVVSTFGSTPTSNSISMSGSQLGVANVNYDPVSPAAPLAESQSSESVFPSTVSLSDLNAIRGSCPDTQVGYTKSSGNSLHSRAPSVSQAEPAHVSQPRHSHLIDQLSRGRTSSKSQLQQMSSVNSPHQHSPISRDSTQASISSLGSPQNNLMPSSSVKPVATPVQAVADSSTASKPKKPRKPRKSKSDIQSDSQSGYSDSLQAQYMSSSQGYAQGSSSYQTQSSLVQQYQQHQENQSSAQQQQYSNSSHSAQAALGVRGSDNYQVLSSVATNQVSPISDQSSRSLQRNTESSLMSMPSARTSSSPLNSSSSKASVGNSAYQEEQNLLAQGQYDLQDYSTQPFMEQLVSGQSVRLIPGNLYSESMHVAAGMAVYQYPYQTAEGSSTIDEAAFSSLLMDAGANKVVQDGSAVMENAGVEMQPPSQEAAPPAAAVPPQPPSPPAKPSATCTNPLEDDDELCNFAQPPPELCDKSATRVPYKEPPRAPQQNTVSQPAPEVETKVKPAASGSKNSAFQDTFMSFLMGQKQETLSSVTAATITERPQLPKYIPEPRRPPPPPPPPAPVRVPAPSAVAFSDDEDDNKVNAAVKKALSTLDSDSNDSEVQEVQGKYCVQSSKDLTMKITLQNTLKKQNKPRGRPAKPKPPPVPVGKGIEAAKAKTTREPTPPPPRESIGRRAKDVAKEKTKKKKKFRESDSSEVELSDEEVKPKRHPGGSGSEYDSDKDPVWTPFEQQQEARRQMGFGFEMPALTDMMKAKKGKSKSKKSHKRQRNSDEMMDSSMGGPQPSKVGRMDSGSETGSGSMPATQVSPHKANGGRTVHTLSAEDQATNVVDENFQVGQYVLEKKDLNNYESYPIWRLEQGRMLRKFELCIQNGRICHKAVSTYSSWVPSMAAAYQPIQVMMISNRHNAEVVEVLEQFRPTPPTDGSLEYQFENDPLVDAFNIFLQTYLSQSLEASFLEAIRKAKDEFYLDPMAEIDKKIESKLDEIDRLVQWKPHFRDAMRTKPQMREINRPNLKQSCQACEKSSPPTIKSVLFHGAAYDRYLLTDLQHSDTSSQEFLVGKFAAPYVTQYHSLHHFKHHLLRRCRAKVYMVREKKESQQLVSESILDKCLADRTWVLKIFQDFKELLGELK